MSRVKWTGTCAALVVLASSGAPARAGDEGAAAGDRESALERRVEQLERQLAELRAASQGGANSELEARVADLEKLTKKDENGLFAYWKTGLRLDSADRSFRLKIGGRIVNDFTWWQGDGDTEQVVGDSLESGSEFRRARMYMAGTIYRNAEYKLEYDFADGGSLKDAYLALRDLIPGTTLTVGHHKPAFGLEELTSSKYVTFAERGVQTTFVPGRGTGVSLGGAALDRELNWRATAYRQTTDAFGNSEPGSDGSYNYAARVAFRPYVNDDGDEYVHVGASALLRSPNDDTIRYRARPQVHIAPRFVDTGDLAVDDVRTGGLELAAVSGPTHFQAEWSGTDVERRGAPDVGFGAYAIQAGHFLTGESRPYSGGAFGRIVPKHAWGDDGGTGAVEVAARYSHIDLNDEDVRGGKMQIWSLGINWYLNPNTRITLDYEWIDLERKAADLTRADVVSAITLRFQIDF